MPSSYDRVLLHTVFGTKYRAPFIDEIVEPQLHKVMSSILVDKGCQVLEINGVADHVHLLHSLPRTQTIANLVGNVKRQSSTWIKDFDPRIYGEFEWQVGYGVFSVGHHNEDIVRRYIRRQKKHHGSENGRVTFREEFEILLEQNGITNYTPEYMFPDRP